jgi:hypothetical protein
MTTRWLAAASLVAALITAGAGGCGDAFTMAPGGSGGAPGTGGSGAGVEGECGSADACPGEDTACRSRTCESGLCGVADAPQGTPTDGEQIDGDCKVEVCNGAGSPELVEDASDIPADDGLGCTAEVCQGGLPVHPFEQAGAACNENGGKVCDGAGLCVECVVTSDCGVGVCQASQCVPESCVNGVFDPGSGETATDCGGPCAPCVNGSGCVVADDCQSGYCMGAICAPCTLDSQCPEEAFCGSSVCLQDKPAGHPCTSAAQCETGSCADSVCCDTACASGCTACSAAKKGMGIDGVCGPVAEGADPDNDCTAQSDASCDEDGSCDGMGQCRLHIFGTPCGQGCSGDVMKTKACDGIGGCVDSGEMDCAPYKCASGICLDACLDATACQDGYYCGWPSNPQCLPLLDEGGACTSSVQCKSKGCCIGPAQVAVCSHCCNGNQDGDETGFDCGGSCPPCATN